MATKPRRSIITENYVYTEFGKLTDFSVDNGGVDIFNENYSTVRKSTAYASINSTIKKIEDHMNMEIWGVVTSSVHFL